MDEQRIIDEYHRLKSCRAVSELLGCSDETVRRALKANNIPRTHWKPEPPKKIYPRKPKPYKAVKYDPRKCKYCGTEFEPHRKTNVFCSKKCKDLASLKRRGVKHNPNTEPYHKVCKVCGKPFDSFREAQVTCSPECAKEYKRNYEAERNKGEMTREQRFAKLKEDAQKRKEIRVARKSLVTVLNAHANMQIRRTCKYCGAEFHSTFNKVSYCSEECKRLWKNRRRDKRIPKAAVVDTDITIKRLYKRDGGVCWICGRTCDWNDWRTAKSGHPFPGKTYPTKDHVIPISRGGKESWLNVRIACHECNCELKRDKMYPFVPMAVEKAYSCRKEGTKAKKTAQYTLDGKLVRVWPSTASIRKELGLSDKHIQNVCRGHDSNTGNAYGFHWEYVKEA